MGKRNKILIRLVAFLSLVRWTHIIFIFSTQAMAQLFLFSTGDVKGDVFFQLEFWAIVFTTGLLVAGGSLLNSFYDLEKDITQRPFRTLLERPVARKYGVRLAISFYFLATLTAWINLEIFIAFSFSVYGILLWLYSHKSWNTNILGPLIATLLAYTPLLILAMASYPESSEGFFQSLPIAMAMILLEWRRQSERISMYKLVSEKRTSAVQRQWIYKALLTTGVFCIAII